MIISVYKNNRGRVSVRDSGCGCCQKDWEPTDVDIDIAIEETEELLDNLKSIKQDRIISKIYDWEIHT